MTNPRAIVWDRPIRVFHWALAALFAVSWWTARHDEMDWHRRSGLTLLGLLLFRLMWGIVGSNTARFAHFVRSPGRVWAYLRAGHGDPRQPGHNPLGAYSVIAMLALLAVQVSTGLFAVDVDGIESGPLSAWVSFDHGRGAARIHGLCFNLLLAMVALHLLALAVYRLRGHRLIGPMLTGRDPQLAPEVSGLIPAALWRLVMAIAVAALVAWWVSKGAPIPGVKPAI